MSPGGEPLELNESRNATEEAILDAARDALADTEYRRLTMDVIAKRAFVSRTALYFYFPNKRALVDRLILRAFLDMYEAAAPYLDGSGDPRAELRRGLARTVKVIDRDAHVVKGAKIGFVTDYLNRPLQDVVAPESGTIMFIRALPSLKDGDTMANIGVIKP